MMASLGPGLYPRLCTQQSFLQSFVRLFISDKSNISSNLSIYDTVKAMIPAFLSTRVYKRIKESLSKLNSFMAHNIKTAIQLFSKTILNNTQLNLVHGVMILLLSLMRIFGLCFKMSMELHPQQEFMKHSSQRWWHWVAQ